MTAPTDPVARLRAFCAEWLKQNKGCEVIDHGFGPEHGGELTTDVVTAVLDELEQLRADEPLCLSPSPDGAHRCLLEPHSTGPHAARTDRGMVTWEGNGQTQAETDGQEQVECNADVRAVARVLRDLRANYPALLALKAVTRLEERFADRIAALDAPMPTEGT